MPDRKRRHSSRPAALRARNQVRLEGAALKVGNRSLALYSGAVHYWRLERDVWRRALEELKNLGLDIVETYVPWGVHETAPNEYDFGERDARKDVAAFVDLAAEIGLYVFIRPGPHINAELTFFGLPERIIYDKACQARSPRHNPVVLSFPPQMFPVPSYASTNFHAEVGHWYDAVGRVLGSKIWPEGPIVLWQVDNEAAFYFRNGPYCQDYHPDAESLWREFLEQRHGDLEAIGRAHHRAYKSWEEVLPPGRFDADTPEAVVVHLDWATFHEHLHTEALEKMQERMTRAGLKNAPFVHNVALGDGGLPISVPQIENVVDIVGFDYYHARREHRTIKRRTLYLAGTVAPAYAPELGVGAPPWFTPLDHEDSMFCALAALAYGLRGFNLYMAVDRDRWYGAPIDARGVPRVEAGAWKHLIGKLHAVRFHELVRRVDVALEVPREYARLSRATHLLGPISPSMIEAAGGTPVDACREDALGFRGPIQTLWWRMLARFADALTEAAIPYVYVDSEAIPARLEGLRAIVTPSYEYASLDRWRKLCAFTAHGGRLVYGPALPSLDEQMRRHPFEVPRNGTNVLIDEPADAVRVVDELARDLALERPFRATPAPVETTVHEDGSGPRVVFVIHPGTTPVEAVIELPSPAMLADAMTGERFDGEHAFNITMEPRTCRMLVVERIAEGAEQSVAGPVARRASR